MLNFLWFLYSPVHENRRKYNLRKPKNAAKALHPLVHTKAENIAGYEKFTLDEVIYPGSDKKEEVNNRHGNEGKMFLLNKDSTFILFKMFTMKQIDAYQK